MAVIFSNNLVDSRCFNFSGCNGSTNSLKDWLWVSWYWIKSGLISSDHCWWIGITIASRFVFYESLNSNVLCYICMGHSLYLSHFNSTKFCKIFIVVKFSHFKFKFSKFSVLEISCALIMGNFFGFLYISIGGDGLEFRFCV